MILETPARPAVEGYDVVLHCRNEKTQSKHIADFYKDDFHLGTWYENNMTIQNVSKSNEGLYKCRISGAGESPESWLAVLKPSKGEFLFLLYLCMFCSGSKWMMKACLISFFQHPMKRLILPPLTPLISSPCCGLFYWWLCCW